MSQERREKRNVSYESKQTTGKKITRITTFSGTEYRQRQCDSAFLSIIIDSNIQTTSFEHSKISIVCIFSILFLFHVITLTKQTLI